MQELCTCTREAMEARARNWGSYWHGGTDSREELANLCVRVRYEALNESCDEEGFVPFTGASILAACLLYTSPSSRD